MSANSKGSGETAPMRRLAWTFAGRLCDKTICTPYHKELRTFSLNVMRSRNHVSNIDYLIPFNSSHCTNSSESLAKAAVVNKLYNIILWKG